MGVVYKITCVINKKVYIGQTMNYESRIKRHIDALKNNRHINTFLQLDYNKYGLSNFKFEIIDYANNRADLLRLEKQYIDYYGGVNDFEQNYCMQDYKTHCEIDKLKIGNANRGKKRSEDFCKKESEVKQAIFISEQGNQIKTKISISLKQYYQTNKGNNNRLKISERMRGRPGYWKNKKLSQETKQRISIKHREAFASGRRVPWNKDRIGLYHHSEESKKKIGEKSRKYSNLFILNLQQEFNKLIKTNNKTTCYKILGDKYAISYQVISLLIRFGTTKHPSYNKSVTTISERE